MKTPGHGRALQGRRRAPKFKGSPEDFMDITLPPKVTDRAFARLAEIGASGQGQVDDFLARASCWDRQTVKVRYNRLSVALY